MNYRNLKDHPWRGASRLVLSIEGDDAGAGGGDPAPTSGDAGGGDPAPADVAEPPAPAAADAPAGAADAPAPEDPPAPAPKPERTPWYTKRIDSLTAAQKSEKEARERAEAQAAETQRQLEAYRALYGDVGGGGAPPAAAPTAPAAPGAPKTYTQAEFDAAVQQQAKLQGINQTLERWYEDGVKTGGDQFKQTIAGARQAFGQELARRTDFFEALTSLPNGDKVYNQLAGDLDHMADVLAMNPMQLGMELGRLSAAAGTAPARRETPISRAPAPITPVDGTGGADKPFDPETSDMNAYVNDFEARRQRRFQERGH